MIGVRFKTTTNFAKPQFRSGTDGCAASVVRNKIAPEGKESAAKAAERNSKMCEFISFLHRPDNGDIFIYNLTSHSNTEEKVKEKNLWREGHYLPDGTVECRVQDSDRISKEECNERLRSRFPTFIDFANYCFSKKPTGIKWLDLSSLTSAQGLKLPNGIKWLDLRSLTSAQGLKLPNGIKWLDLSSDIWSALFPEGYEDSDWTITIERRFKKPQKLKTCRRHKPGRKK